MAKCNFCQQRKGKRSCPALESVICTLCCGENRGSKINCPDTCPYFIPHETYQKERLAEHFLNQRKVMMRQAFKKGGEKALIFLNLIDLATYGEFHKHPDTPPSAVLDGLEMVRQKLSPLTVPLQFTSKFGEKLLKGIEDVMKEINCEKDFASELIEGNIEFIKSFATEKTGSSSFLKGLIGFVETYLPEEAQKMREKEAPDTIITPGALSQSKNP